MFLGHFIATTMLVFVTAPAPLDAESVKTGSKALSLKEFISLAVEYSPDRKASSLEVKTAELTRKNAVTKFLPRLDLESTHGFRDSRPKGDAIEAPWASEARYPQRNAV